MKRQTILFGLLAAASSTMALVAIRKSHAKTTPPVKQNLKPETSVHKVTVNKQFFRQFKYIFNICIPNIQCKTTGIVILHTLFLILRTYLSVVVARIDGKLVKDLVNLIHFLVFSDPIPVKIGANKGEFIKGLVYWFTIAIPATFTNGMIKYYQSMLAITLRTTLTKHAHQVYLDRKTYYKAINLDHRLESIDQLISTDIKKFADSFASLYSNIGKPLLDIIIFNYQIARTIGVAGMSGLLLNYFITALIMKAITPSFGKFAATEAKLEVPPPFPIMLIYV